MSSSFEPRGLAKEFSASNYQKKNAPLVMLYRDLASPFCSFYKFNYTSMYHRRPAPTLDMVRWFIYQWMTGGAWQYTSIGNMLQHHMHEKDYVAKATIVEGEIMAWLDVWRGAQDVVAEHILFPHPRPADSRGIRVSLKRMDVNMAIVGHLIRRGEEVRFQAMTLRPASVASWADQLPHVWQKIKYVLRRQLIQRDYDPWRGFPDTVCDERLKDALLDDRLSNVVELLVLGENGKVVNRVEVEGRGKLLYAEGIPAVWEHADVKQGTQLFSEACSYCPARKTCNPGAPECTH